MFWATKKDIEIIVAPLIERIRLLESARTEKVRATPKTNKKVRSETEKARAREYAKKYYHRKKASQTETVAPSA